MLASCGSRVMLLDGTTFTSLDSFPNPTEKASCKFTDLSWSADHKSLAILQEKGPVETLRVKDGRFLSTEALLSNQLKNDSYPTAISFMCNSNRYLAIGTAKGSIAIWDCKAGNIRKTFSNGDDGGAVRFVDFNAFGSHIAAGMSSGNVLVYEYSSNTNTCYRIPHSTSVSSLRYQPSQNSLVGAGSGEGHVAFWNTISGAEVYSLVGAHRDAVTGLAFSPVYRKLAVTVSLDKQLCGHDLMHGQQAVISVSTEFGLTSVDLCPDGYMAVAGTVSGQLLTFDLRSLSYPLSTTDIHRTAVHRLRFAKRTAAEGPSVVPGSASSSRSVNWSPALSSVPEGNQLSTPVSSRYHVDTLSTETPATRNGMCTTFEQTPCQRELPIAKTGYDIFSPLQSDSSESTNYDSMSDSTGSRSNVKIERDQPLQDGSSVALGYGMFPNAYKLKSSNSESSLQNTSNPLEYADILTPGPQRCQPITPDPTNMFDGFAINTPATEGSNLGAATNQTPVDPMSLAATGYGIFSPLNSNLSTASEPSFENTSTPVDNIILSHFPFADPFTNTEISPIVEAAAMEHSLARSPSAREKSTKTSAEPSPPDEKDSGPSLADVLSARPSLDSETEAEVRLAEDVDADRPYDESSKLLDCSIDPDAWSTSSDLDYHSQDEGLAGGDSANVQQASASIVRTDGSGSLSQVLTTGHLGLLLEQLVRIEDTMVARFDRIEGSMAKLNERIDHLESRHGASRLT